MEILLSGQLLVAALIIGSIYGLVALGLNLIYGTMRLLNIAHGDLIVLSSFLGLAIVSGFGLHPLICLLIVVPLISGPSVKLSTPRWSA